MRIATSKISDHTSALPFTETPPSRCTCVSPTKHSILRIFTAIIFSVHLIRLSAADLSHLVQSTTNTSANYSNGDSDVIAILHNPRGGKALMIRGKTTTPRDS